MKKLFPIFLILFTIRAFSQEAVPEFWAKQLDNAGIYHNEAMDYAFDQLKTGNIAAIKNKDDVNKIVAKYVGEYYFKKYAEVRKFSLEDLQSLLYKTGYEPTNTKTLQLSPALTEAVQKIQEQLTVSTNAESFKQTTENIANLYSVKLDEKEKIYLKDYKNVITSSFEYWSANLPKWQGLLPGSTQKGKVNAQSVIGSDGGGLLSGAVSGCIGGTLFGAVVGCAVGGIFMGAVGAATASLGNIIGQLLFSWL